VFDGAVTGEGEKEKEGDWYSRVCSPTAAAA